MPGFSQSSREELETCDERLQGLAHILIKNADITIVEGHRDKQLQNLYYRQDKSHLRWPNSYHNAQPALAMDIAPWTGQRIAWNDEGRWRRLIALVRSLATTKLEVPIVLGADWDMDLGFDDSRPQDWPHIQLDVDYEPKGERDS